jgi:hypothetical protein
MMKPRKSSTTSNDIYGWRYAKYNMPMAIVSSARLNPIFVNGSTGERKFVERRVPALAACDVKARVPQIKAAAIRISGF